jgi:hypothetical protein
MHLTQFCDVPTLSEHWDTDSWAAGKAFMAGAYISSVQSYVVSFVAQTRPECSATTGMASGTEFASQGCTFDSEASRFSSTASSRLEPSFAGFESQHPIPVQCPLAQMLDLAEHWQDT